MTLSGLVAQSYAKPEWAVFFEVSNATGFGARRRADAVALGVWPSRGQTLIGFEFKESRSDWMREKDNPAKAEEIAQHCDCWYVVAGSKGIVKVEELPAPWGLKVANEDRTKLMTVKECTPFPDRDKTIMKRSFVAAMLRKVSETTVPHAELNRLVAEGVEAETKRLRDGREMADLRASVQRQQDIIDTFKRETGVDLEGWNGPKDIAAAVSTILRLDSDRDAIVRAQRLLHNAALTMTEAIKAWPVLQAEASPPLSALPRQEAP